MSAPSHVQQHHLFHHIHNFTSTTSHPQLHIHNLTSTTSHPQLHIHNLTSTTSHPQPHIHNFTSTTSHPQPHSQLTATVFFHLLSLVAEAAFICYSNTSVTTFVVPTNPLQHLLFQHIRYNICYFNTSVTTFVISTHPLQQFSQQSFVSLIYFNKLASTTLPQHFHLNNLFHASSTYFYNFNPTVLFPHSVSTVYFNILLQHCTSTLYFNIVLQHCTSTLYFNIVLQHFTSTFYFNIVLQHCFSTIPP